MDPLFYFYFLRPIRSLAEHWQIKLPVSVLFAFLYDSASKLTGVYGDLLSMPVYLIGMATICFFADFLTAVLAAYERDGLSGIELIRFRQLLLKGAYWAIIIGVASNIATGGSEAGIPYAGLVDEVVVTWLSLQDGYSAVQNWKGSQGAREWFQGAVDLAQGGLSLDQANQKSHSHSDA